jgi:hypothetical protein
MIGSAIYQLLSTDTAIIAIVGDRVYPHTSSARSSLPQVVFKVNDGDQEVTLDGPSDLATQQVSVACISQNYDTTDTLGDLVKAALGNEADNWGGTTILNVIVTGGSIEDVSVDDDDTTYYVRSFDCDIAYRP